MSVPNIEMELLSPLSEALDNFSKNNNRVHVWTQEMISLGQSELDDMVDIRLKLDSHYANGLSLLTEHFQLLDYFRKLNPSDPVDPELINRLGTTVKQIEFILKNSKFFPPMNAASESVAAPESFSDMDKPIRNLSMDSPANLLERLLFSVEIFKDVLIAQTGEMVIDPKLMTKTAKHIDLLDASLNSTILKNGLPQNLKQSLASLKLSLESFKSVLTSKSYDEKRLNDKIAEIRSVMELVRSDDDVNESEALKKSKESKLLPGVVIAALAGTGLLGTYFAFHEQNKQ